LCNINQQYSRHPRKPEHLNRKKTAILLVSYGPLRDALAYAEDALSRNRDVLFVAFKPEWESLLEPILDERISLKLLPRDMPWSLKRPFSSIASLVTTLRHSRRLAALLRGQEVILFCASISTPCVIVSGLLSKVAKTLYTPKHEGRGESWSHLSMQETGHFRQLKAKLLSLLSGVEIEPRRPWSPVLTISDRFLFSHTEPLKPLCTTGKQLLLKLCRRLPAKCLVCFTDYTAIWPTSERESEYFHEQWENVARILSRHFPRDSVVIKAHPKTPRLPEYLSSFNVIDSGLPMDIFELTGLQVVIFDATGAVRPYLSNQSIACLSIGELFMDSWEGNIYSLLDENVDAKQLAYRANSIQNFEVLLQRVLT
jgi:hypothetical protein